MSLDSVRDKINDRLKDAPLFFVVPAVERALGLENILENFHVASVEDGYFSKNESLKHRVKIFSDQPSTAKLIESDAFVGLLEGHKHAYLQFFKNTSDDAFHKLNERVGGGVTLLNNTASLTRSIENKLKQYELFKLSELSNYLPDTIVTTQGELDLETYRQKWGEFIVQTAFGHTGESSEVFTKDSDIKNSNAVDKLKQKPQLACKVSQYVNGDSYTINACIYKKQVYVGGLSYQYTGLDQLTALKAATVGNDWFLPGQLLPGKTRHEIVELAQKVGQLLIEKYDFHGLFGIDLVVDKNERIYLIEVNPRQVASIPVFTKLQIQNKQIPLALINLLEFLDIDENINLEEYNSHASQSYQAAQIFLRYRLSQPGNLQAHQIKAGVYRQMSDNEARKMIAAGRKHDIIYLDHTEDRPLVWQKDFLTVADFGSDGIGITMKDPGANVRFNEEVARVLAHRSLAQNLHGEIRLLPLVSDLFRRLETHLINFA